MKKSSDLYLSAREASAELAVSPATLYAYVSRGLIRSEPSPDSRSHRYRAEDVRGLKERRLAARGPPGLPRFELGPPPVDWGASTPPPDAPRSAPRTFHRSPAHDNLQPTPTLLSPP